MGHGLQRLTRAHGAKLPVVITEGNIRPVEPKIAAMYATECNIAVRNHIPVFKHWKEYKKHHAMFELFLGRLRVSTLPKLIAIVFLYYNYIGIILLDVGKW